MKTLAERHEIVFVSCMGDFFAHFFPELLASLQFEARPPLIDNENRHLIGEGREADTDTLVSIQRKVRKAWETILVYWELRSRRPRDLDKLMFYEYHRLYSQHQQFIFPIVLYTGEVNRDETPADPFGVIVEQYRVFQFQLIELKRFTADEFMQTAGSNPLAWAYLPFTEYKVSRRPEIFIRALQGIAEHTDEEDKNKRYSLASLVVDGMDLDELEKSQVKDIFEKRTEFTEAKMVYSLVDEGIDIGLRQASVRHARAFLEKGIDPDVVEEVTGMTAKDLAEDRAQRTGLQSSGGRS